MPLIHSAQIGPDTKIGIWHLEEPESYFTERVQPVTEARHPHKRRQHLAARYLLTELMPGFPVNRIQAGSCGKPYIPGHAWHFSLSHCGNRAAAIISSRSRTGIDIEDVGQKVERVAARFLGPQELAFLEEGQRRLQLTVCWCAKEAVYKWHGEGGVDFREDIRLAQFFLQPAGMIRASYGHGKGERLLTVYYLANDAYCVAWVVE